MANKFKDFYKVRIFKESAEQRLIQIDFAINDLIAELQSVVNPTKWNEILRSKEMLEAERDLITNILNPIN